MNDIPNSHTQSCYIHSYMVDSTMRLTVSHLMCLLQELAWQHSNNAGVGWYYLQSRNLFWVICKVYLRVYRMPRCDEMVTARTWAKPVRRVLHPRDYELYDQAGHLLVAATSDWAILDKTTFEPQQGQFENEEQMIDSTNAVEKNTKRVPPISVENPTFQPVLYSDIDMNRHVNNTRYLVWTFDHFDPQLLTTHRVSECIIYYLAQTQLGTSYAVMQQETAPQQWTTSIISQEDGRELCRVRVAWEKE